MKKPLRNVNSEYRTLDTSLSMEFTNVIKTLKKDKIMKCKWCGKEFESVSGKQYCSWDCRRESDRKTNLFNKAIKRIADKHNFEIKNREKIINAKKMLFGGDNMLRCPCDAENPERFCGSARCISDVMEQGHCHCSLFWLKNDIK